MYTPPRIHLGADGEAPEKHAARVAGDMCRWLARESFRVRDLVARIKSDQRSLGNPNAQKRFLLERARRLAGETLAIRMETGIGGAKRSIDIASVASFAAPLIATCVMRV
jgi:hypothetical protein